MRKKLTKNEVLASAKKYKSKTEWKNNHYSAYYAARMNGWSDEATAHMPQKKSAWDKRGVKWTKTNVLKSAKEYSSKLDWKKSQTGAYQAAKKHGWFEEATAHMDDLGGSLKWTKPAVLKEAKNFETKVEWAQFSASSYVAALRKNWVEEASVHMRSLGHEYKRCVYEISVSNEKISYIGLTFNFDERIAAHKHTERIKNLIEDYGENSINYHQLTDYIDSEQAQILESKLVQQRTAEGFTLLNIAKAGSLGYKNDRKWTKASVFADAKKYNSPSEWKKNSVGAYQKARKMKWFTESTAHMSKKTPDYYWTFKKILNAAQNYETLKAWREAEGGTSYQQAVKKKLINEIIEKAGLKRGHAKKNSMTLEQAIELAKNSDCLTVRAWRQKYPTAYKYLLKTKNTHEIARVIKEKRELSSD